VIAVALTSQEPRAGFPLTVKTNARGLSKESWIKVSQIRTLAVERIGRRLGVVSAEKIARVLDGLNEIVG
jgi:mRNA interferase MazF